MEKGVLYTGQFVRHRQNICRLLGFYVLATFNVIFRLGSDKCDIHIPVVLTWPGFKLRNLPHGKTALDPLNHCVQFQWHVPSFE